ncbi:MAG: hypothetical protein OXG56_06820 [Gammaproteobacteria bacterium]|nr:hypothetical protein [Gammaproteobacteria bacterium]
MENHASLMKSLFFDFYKAATEAELEPKIQKAEMDFHVRWVPYGNNESYFGVIENQQASPIPALVEKVTNSIDAILMKRCYEEGIDPKSSEAPKSIEDAVSKFFPHSSNWDLAGRRAEQSENIQIIADGPRKETSLIIYDNGEGQHPEDFNDTFLSLLKGNKNEIQFVQGKYNMGGAGGVVFCGKKRYQLIASKQFRGNGKFGFTLLRKHPLNAEESITRRNTWYEYLTINGAVPAFDIETLDIGLLNRKFATGSIIKLYSYQLPAGSRSVISRDLNQSINEYLFEPALPIYTIDNKERYPRDINLNRDLFGLKRRMEADGNKYIKEIFSEDSHPPGMGPFKATVYVFHPRLPDKTVKETKETIQREFFKNNMSVLFSLNGQVHGHYTTEFITRSLKFPLLKNFLLIHVDCSRLKLDFRNALFMASRDRLKHGEESYELRKELANVLSRGRLKDIYKEMKEGLTSGSESGNQLLQDFSKNLPLDSELVKLLNQTFNLKDRKGSEPGSKKPRKTKKQGKEIPFNPNRYPSSFSIDINSRNDNIPLTKIPLQGDKTIPFSTDVEDQYFDRVEDPGELVLSVLGPSDNDNSGGDKPGRPKDINDIFNISKSSPSKGTIRVNMQPTGVLNVGDSVTVKASLTSPNGDLEQIFIVKISDKQKNNPQNVKKKTDPESIGLPKLQEVFRTSVEDKKCWGDLESEGIDFDYQSVMYPLVEGDKLDTIFINMDGKILKSYKSKLKTEEQIVTADRRYLSAVYFHTIFLYMITKNRNYVIKRMGENANDRDEDVELSEYLVDIFNTYYSEFLLNFEMSALLEALSE